jgi:hydroxyethylthiazole kinase-like uncharacterized protein yjeF
MNEFNIQGIELDQKFIYANTGRLFYTTETEIIPLIKKRDRFSHKGTFGHALLIGGSYGKVGAARLAAEACLRAGVGLLTAFVPKCAYVIMQTSVPECMLLTAETITTISSLPEIRDYDAIGIGPGLSQDKECLESLAILLISTQTPLVIDADALNLLASNPHLFIHLPENSILTPHAKELERLVGESETRTDQVEKALDFAKKHKVIIVLKGINTAVCLPNGEVHFNSTGNPGMATGGTGDALTGVILSLLAQGYSSKNAAILGVYRHGEAGDNAANEKGEAALLARDIIDRLRID